ncbi:MAG: hypothetical protein MZV49_03925 [Rhodopseudomonas palustris]|nr:hypothetical protein [Rhodopseudomonas palustris]
MAMICDGGRLKAIRSRRARPAPAAPRHRCPVSAGWISAGRLTRQAARFAHQAGAATQQIAPI